VRHARFLNLTIGIAKPLKLMCKQRNLPLKARNPSICGLPRIAALPYIAPGLRIPNSHGGTL
jgi:hypothetical protein